MEQELDVLLKTDHPNIVRVVALLHDDFNFYIVTDFVSGGELFNHIINNKVFSEANSANMIKQLLLAVNYMH